MAEKDLHTLQREFRNIVAPVATAEISEEGAARSAGIIVELDEKMLKKRTEPIDLFRATLATSQLIERWSQQQQRLAAGSILSVNDVDTVKSIQEKFAGGLPSEEYEKVLGAKATKDLKKYDPLIWRVLKSRRQEKRKKVENKRKKR